MSMQANPNVLTGSDFLHRIPAVPLQAPGAARVPLVAPARSVGAIKLWQLIVAQLDLDQSGYSTREIAELFGVTGKSVTRWCRVLFPRDKEDTRSVYWLEFEQAVVLIRKICDEGRGLPTVAALYSSLMARGIITANFPADNAAVQAAEQILVRRRSQILQRSH